MQKVTNQVIRSTKYLMPNVSFKFTCSDFGAVEPQRTQGCEKLSIVVDVGTRPKDHIHRSEPLLEHPAIVIELNCRIPGSGVDYFEQL